jgi:hypothetical protein
MSKKPCDVALCNGDGLSVRHPYDPAVPVVRT